MPMPMMQAIAGGRTFIFARALAGAGAYSDAGKLGVVTADDITQALTRLDAAVAALQVTIDACPRLPAATVAQWNAWKAGYASFSKENKDHNYFALGLPAIGDETIAYEDDTQAWYRVIAAAVKSSGCAVALPPTPETHDQAGGDSIASTASALAWLVGIAGVVYLGVTYLPRPKRS